MVAWTSSSPEALETVFEQMVKRSNEENHSEVL